MLGRYPRDTGEWNNNTQGKKFTYHNQNISINLVPIGEDITFPPVSASKFTSRKIQRIKLAMTQFRTHNCTKENNI